jgi:hypothetical protein
MKKSILVPFIAMFTLCATSAQAQQLPTKSREAIFTTAIGSSEFSTALAYQHLWLVGKKRRLGLGAGLRLTNYFGSNKYFTTAPAKLTSGQTGPGVFFADNIEENIDSVLFKNAQVNSLNLSINIQYAFSKKFAAGFNIDAIGFSFGGQKDATYFGNNGTGGATSAKPTGFNLLLISDNDKGSLNSEIYGKYMFNNKWAVKLGYQFLFVEYTTDTEVQTTPDGQTNDRFRNKSSGILLGVTRSF